MRYRILVAAAALLTGVLPLFTFVLVKDAAAYTSTYYSQTTVADNATQCWVARQRYPSATYGKSCVVVLKRWVTLNSDVPNCRWDKFSAVGGLGLWVIDLEIQWCFNGSTSVWIDWERCYIERSVGFTESIDWCGAWNAGDTRHIGHMEPGFNYYVSILWSGSPIGRSGWVRADAFDTGDWCCERGA